MEGNKRMRVLVVFLFWLLTLAAQGQNSSVKSDSLAVLKERFQKEYELQTAKSRAYAQQKNIPLSYRDANGHLVSLAGIEDDGVTPRYITVDNAGAAVTTGVVKLREGGGLGLNLEGEGMVVGVWDEGIVLTDHVEFDQRIIQAQGSALSEHSTHVSGTIMASGVNANAKGMAPKAKVTSWDWNNALSEMASLVAPDQTSLLFSNHSWGTITGWAYNNGSWTWYGNSSISDQEDYRFGFYSSSTRSWDELAYNAPYFTICKSAGNDRNNTGSGAYPADCDLGSGFDCLGDVAVAKNIITIGAVSKVPNYTGPASVQMSSFSSWGPTDDGRIKPDLVGAGVNIYSAIATNQTSYGSLSGTSMATPNVTGSLTLLQELYKKINGSYMRSTTLKALAIHTTKEAGDSPGPDYKFGWGLLDVEAAAKVILQEDKSNIFIEEKVLMSGQTIEFNLNPVQGKKITATIVWADPAANPTAPALDPTNLMLVNDLDIRIVDSGTGIYYPWILNPSVPNIAADRGDNFRDNVEKIEFENPQSRPYNLVVSNKGQLQGGSQAFSIIISYTSDNDNSIAYYWIDGSGDWSDPSHWSLTSGGVSAGVSPTINDRVFFDENSFNTGSTITFNVDAEAASLVWFATENVSFVLNNHVLEIGGNFMITSANVSSQGPGTFSFSGNRSAENTLTFNNNVFKQVLFEFDGASRWNVRGLKEVGALSIVQGHVDLREQQLVSGKLLANSPSAKILDIAGASISGLSDMVLVNENLDFRSSGTVLQVSNSALVNWSEISFLGSLILEGADVEFSGSNNELSQLTLGNTVNILGNNSILNLQIKPGTSLELASNSVQTLHVGTTLSSTEVNPITISSNGSENAVIEFDGHFKLCFDNLIINQVDASGEGVVSVGSGSQITNSLNWYTQPCDEVLFADFTYVDNCVGSLVQFESVSTGNIDAWEWDFGDPDSEDDVSTLEHPSYIYESEGTYAVTLTISSGEEIRSYTTDIVIGLNNLADNHIVMSNGRLYSFQTASSYQWYRNNEKIEGATSRSYDFLNQEGTFVVVTKNSDCNKVSEPYINVVTGNEQFVLEMKTLVYPNPSSGVLNIEVPFTGDYVVRIYDSFGRTVKESSYSDSRIVVSMNGNKAGLYLLQIVKGTTRITKKVILNHQ